MKKILSIILCGLLIISGFVLNIINVNLVKSDTTPQITDALPLDYIWNETKIISNVTYKAYPPGEIARGRAFASAGGTYASNILKNELNNFSLSDVHTEQLKHIYGHPLKFYSDIINVTDYDLTINGNDPWLFSSRTITKNEMSAFQLFPTRNSSFSEAKIKPYDFTSDSILAGSLNDHHFIVNNYELLSNNDDLIVGNVSYLSANDEVPNSENQTGRIFIVDDILESQSKVENLSDSNAVIIIDSGTRGIENVSISAIFLIPTRIQRLFQDI